MNHFKRLILAFYCSLFTIFSYGQCAMCKAGAEQSLENGATDVAWINYGILGLMIMPFLLIFGLYRLYKINNR